MKVAQDSLTSATTLANAGLAEHTTAENATRMAINALASADGLRTVGANRHQAAIRYIEVRPNGFDARSTNAIDALRRQRNASMYGDSDNLPVAVSERQVIQAIDVAGKTIARVRVLTALPIPPPPGSN